VREYDKLTAYKKKKKHKLTTIFIYVNKLKLPRSAYATESCTKR